MIGFATIKTSVKGDKPVNQDAILTYENDDLIVLTLADGLGSATHSDKGSFAICRSIIENVKIARRTSSPLSGTNILNYWDTTLRERGFNPQDCMTTSSFAVINKQTKNVTTAQIGDSQIYLIVDGKLIYTTKEKDFSNVTECLNPSKVVKYDLNSVHFENSIRVLIASDGICDEIEPNAIPEMADYLIERYSSMPTKKRNLALSGEVRRSFSKRNADDKSIIFLWN